MANQIDYETIRERAEARVKRRNDFFTHVGWYIGINLFCWAIWWFSGGSGFAWPMLLTGLWGIGVFFDLLDFISKSRFGDLQHETAVQREIERELKYHGLTAEELLEKPKRRQDLRLADDGELVPADSDEEEVIKHKPMNHS